MRGLKSKEEVDKIAENKSHPSWVRGLKFDGKDAFDIRVVVAPFMGAWIEMPGMTASALATFRSHPSWVRGLKSG